MAGTTGDNSQFIDYLSERGLLSQQQRDVLDEEAGKLSSKSIEEILLEKKFITEKNLFEAKSNFLKIPLRKVEDWESVPKEILELMTSEAASRYRFVPLSKKEDFLEIGMVDPADFRAQEALRFFAMKSPLPVKTVLITLSDFLKILKQFSTLSAEATEQLDKLAKELSEEQRKLEGKEKKQEVKATIFEDAPITKLVAVIIKHAHEGKASDVHIEPMENDLRVRFRIDGLLYTSLVLPKNVHQAVIARLKIMCDMKIDESRIPQDGRFKIALENTVLDFRVSIFPTQKGEKAAMRLLDPTAGNYTLQDLGVLGRSLDIFEWALQQPYGMVLITGPTGSGKSTTLSILLRLLNKEDINITTLEDPVEYEVSGTNQSQIMTDIGYTFAKGLRHILRQDPDIIMVGEIRDQESAALAVQSALTGHLFFSTLHTNNAVGIIPRLIDMKIEKYLLPSSLLLMEAQRLVRKICDDCKVKKEAPQWATAVIKSVLADLPEKEKERYKDIIKGPYFIYEGKGCVKCNNKGVRGRVGIFEMMQMNPDIEDIILGDISEHKLEEAAKAQGMVTLQQDAVIKLLLGMIPMNEALALIRDQITRAEFEEAEEMLKKESAENAQAAPASAAVADVAKKTT
jgi:type IV pilus assembly protein PilB